jgi:hypothetical protein
MGDDVPRRISSTKTQALRHSWQRSLLPTWFHVKHSLALARTGMELSSLFHVEQL